MRGGKRARSRAKRPVALWHLPCQRWTARCPLQLYERVPYSPPRATMRLPDISAPAPGPRSLSRCRIIQAVPRCGTLRRPARSDSSQPPAKHPSSSALHCRRAMSAVASRGASSHVSPEDPRQVGEERAGASHTSRATDSREPREGPPLLAVDHRTRRIASLGVLVRREPSAHLASQK